MFYWQTPKEVFEEMPLKTSPKSFTCMAAIGNFNEQTGLLKSDGKCNNFPHLIGMKQSLFKIEKEFPRKT